MTMLSLISGGAWLVFPGTVQHNVPAPEPSDLHRACAGGRRDTRHEPRRPW
ncbi:hypothetical protein AB0G73_19675 [Streptomyces sp. NPDC020719]|uniref:hypothetical protein n=1 Tax=unclassified Streptomyces TaxID=2593676 RepID=UPI00340BBBDD